MTEIVPTISLKPFGKISVEQIAFKHGVPTAIVMTPCRKTAVVRARWEVMWTLRNTLKWSYPKISAFLKMDHSSVIHGVRRHDAILAAQLSEVAA